MTGRPLTEPTRPTLLKAVVVAYSSTAITYGNNTITRSEFLVLLAMIQSTRAGRSIQVGWRVRQEASHRRIV